MNVSLLRIGESRTTLLTLDGYADPAQWTAWAAAMAPFPDARDTYYPGLRRVIAEEDGEPWRGVQQLLESVAPSIGDAFDCAGFDLIEASFSMVTTPPARLDAAQRVPHFDSTDPDYLALLLYLSETTGTAFYRQRATGIEVVTADNLSAFIASARRESMAMAGYVAGPNAFFDAIGRVDGRAGRLAVYPGRLLHSGIIPQGQMLGDDPATGRLTLNLFVRGHR